MDTFLLHTHSLLTHTHTHTDTHIIRHVQQESRVMLESLTEQNQKQKQLTGDKNYFLFYLQTYFILHFTL